MSDDHYAAFDFFECTLVSEGVLKVALNRPLKGNRMSKDFWVQLPLLCDAIRADISRVKVVILLGNGKHFSTGLDLSSMSDTIGGSTKSKDPARKAFHLQQTIRYYFQSGIDKWASLPQCTIALINGACIGGGIDLISSCDIRWCVKEAKMSVKEVDVGLVADVGTMARVSRITGNESLFRELCFTGRMFGGSTAMQLGLVSRVLNNTEELLSEGLSLASQISQKSPIALAGIKRMAEYAMDHSVQDCQDYVSVWNSVMLQSKDVPTAAIAMRSKQPPKFAKL